MPRVLQAQAHGVFALTRVGKSSTFPLSSHAWRSKTRSLWALHVDQRVEPTTAVPIVLPSFQPAGVGTWSRGCRARQRQRSSDFAERCAWTR